MDNSQLSIITKTNQTYSSITPKTKEDKIKLFNLSEKCDCLLKDVKGTEIAVKDVVISAYPRENKQTGEALADGHRTILVDETGKSYLTLSNYFYYALVKLFSTFGEPTTWTEPVKIKIVGKQIKGSQGEALGFELIG